jgi:hypothetical protein
VSEGYNRNLKGEMIDVMHPDGFGARFRATLDEFIGFINRSSFPEGGGKSPTPLEPPILPPP